MLYCQQYTTECCCNAKVFPIARDSLTFRTRYGIIHNHSRQLAKTLFGGGGSRRHSYGNVTISINTVFTGQNNYDSFYYWSHSHWCRFIFQWWGEKNDGNILIHGLKTNAYGMTNWFREDAVVVRVLGIHLNSLMASESKEMQVFLKIGYK